MFIFTSVEKKQAIIREYFTDFSKKLILIYLTVSAASQAKLKKKKTSLETRNE